MDKIMKNKIIYLCFIVLLLFFGLEFAYSQQKSEYPQTQGKVERFNRTTKSKTVNLIVYCSPDELQKSLRETVKKYNHTPHTALNNVSPADVYAGRKEEILKRRADLKKLTLERRKMYNLGIQEVKENV